MRLLEPPEDPVQLEVGPAALVEGQAPPQDSEGWTKVRVDDVTWAVRPVDHASATDGGWCLWRSYDPWPSAAPKVAHKIPEMSQFLYPTIAEVTDESWEARLRDHDRWHLVDFALEGVVLKRSEPADPKAYVIDDRIRPVPE